MQWVWDSAEGKQSPEFTSEKQAQRILDLLMRHANTFFHLALASISSAGIDNRSGMCR
jgi:hypothetical protein